MLDTDQIKIGKFIASCRKEQAMTQAALAEKLGISDRAVSKWETGKSMPDSGIMLELCGLLKINVNELLSGERITMDDYKAKAEENMIGLQERQEKASKDFLRVECIWLAVIVLLITPAHLAINYYFPDNHGTGMGGVAFIVGLIMFTVFFKRHYEIKLK